MKSMDEIYQKYAQTVYRYLLSLTQNPDLAEELTQETFYQAIRTSNRFDHSCQITTWLCGIARNVLRTYRRKHPDTVALDAEGNILPDSEPGAAERAGHQAPNPESSPAGELPSHRSAEESVLQSMERIEILRNLHELEDPYREVLYLRFFGDLSFKEIGEILSKSENWARVTFYRGKEKLKNQLRR